MKAQALAIKVEIYFIFSIKTEIKISLLRKTNKQTNSGYPYSLLEC